MKKINIFKKGRFFSEEVIDFSDCNPTRVIVTCDEQGCDEVILKKDALNFLNQLASEQGRKVTLRDDYIRSINAPTERGESARVKLLDFGIDILDNC